jgi:hypothetical protein
VTSIVESQSQAQSRAARMPLERIQLLACEAIIVGHFLSVWRYKTWFLATGAALAVTAFVFVLGSLRTRGLVRDLWPLGLYFAYLFAASTQSDYAAEASYWVAVDSVGILVAALFWLAFRNNTAADLRRGFIRISQVGLPIVAILYLSFPTASRLGGYALPFFCVSLPFLWVEIIGRGRRLQALLTMTLILAVLLLSRSRTPLVAAAAVLTLSLFWMGRNFTQRLKVGILLTVIMVVTGTLLMSVTTTRVLLLTFVARVTHKDIITSDLYVPGEPKDLVRVRLDDIVKEQLFDAQPFGVGYTTAGHLYERKWGEYVPLHSMYMTWLIEGGVICFVLGVAILLRHFLALRRARRAAATSEDELLARCLTLGTLAVLLVGLFHQMHQGPLFYAMLGASLGFRQRVLSERWYALERT